VPTSVGASPIAVWTPTSVGALPSAVGTPSAVRAAIRRNSGSARNVWNPSASPPAPMARHRVPTPATATPYLDDASRWNELLGAACPAIGAVGGAVGAVGSLITTPPPHCRYQQARKNSSTARNMACRHLCRHSRESGNPATSKTYGFRLSALLRPERRFLLAGRIVPQPASADTPAAVNVQKMTR